jgi:hypothetical protein
MLSRRGFLIGAGSLLTAAFVKEATAVVRSTGLPLLIAPPEPRYYLFWMHGRLALGPTWSCEQPPQPTWREFLSDLSFFDTPEEFAYQMRRHGVTADRLDEPVNDWSRRHWDIFQYNDAAAHRLLKRIDLGPSLDGSYGGPCLEFRAGHRIDNFPNCSVTVTHPLALSMLQARLIELKLPICVRLSSAAFSTADCRRQLDEYVQASLVAQGDGEFSSPTPRLVRGSPRKTLLRR